MRFWKTGTAAALAISAAAAVQLGGAEVQGQVVRERDVRRPADQVRRVQQLLTVFGGTRLGITIDDVDADDVKAKKLSSESGVIVEDVDDDSPASKAGIKAGDVIVEFDGERVRSEGQLRRLIQETPAGRKVGIAVMRDGQRMSFTVTPDAREAQATVMPRLETSRRISPTPRPQVFQRVLPTPQIDVRVPRLEVFRDGTYAFSVGGGRLGVTTQILTSQLARHFGVERGALVTEVREDSAAGKAGLRAGDVITKVNGASIDDSGDLSREISRASGEVTIEIVRDRKTQTLKATIEPARPRTPRRII